MELNKQNQIFIFFLINFLFSMNINADNDCEQGWTYFSLTQLCYKVITNKTFALAQQQCFKQNSGSSLVSIHSYEENEFVNNLVEETVEWNSSNYTSYPPDSTTLTALIGLHYTEYSLIWSWVDESIVDYTNWDLNEPNNLLDENCVETIVRVDKPNPTVYGFQKLHSWNNIRCHMIRPAAVCAYKSVYFKDKLYYVILIIISILVVIIAFLKVRQRRQSFCGYRIFFHSSTKPDVEYYSNTFMMLIKKDQLLMKKVIGKGSFGVVYNDWYDEASIMAQLKHEHLLPLIGICIADGLKIITPLRPMGSLKLFLQKEKDKLDAIDLVSYCFQIASGMEYLSNKKIVHCDLAARNVLMRKSDHVEVTDFGLAKMVSNKMPDSEKSIPVRWTALECLTTNSKFSESSDVWSFGITCWEIITFGQMQPYSNCKLEEKPTLIESLVEYLIQGGRLISESGEICTLELYKVLIQCWAENPITRPKFKELREFFDKYRAEPARIILNVQPSNLLDKSMDSDQRQLNRVKGILGDEKGTLDDDKGTLSDVKGIFGLDNTADQIEKLMSQGIILREKNDSEKSSLSESSTATNKHDIQVEIHNCSSDEEEEISDEEKI